MLVSIFQPSYSKPLEIVDLINGALNECPENYDLLVLPEYSNCPAMSDINEMKTHCRNTNESFINKVKAIAKDKKMAISINMLVEENDKLYNTTYFIDRSGEIVYTYRKTHLAYPEIDPMGLTPGNSLGFFTWEGINIGFAVCFEMYFPEIFESLASNKPNLIIAPTYQRSELEDVIISQTKARALDTESYIIRSSYSMGKNSTCGGNSCIVSPKGDVLLNAKQETGLFTIKINPFLKRKRPLAYGLDQMNSRDIVEKYRKPELYRNNNEVSLLTDFKYPRICAHRGLSKRVPENTLPAFMAAYAIGADEIEFDVRLTKDNKMIISHDPSLNRVACVDKKVNEITFDEMRKINAGAYMNWEHVKFPTPEEIFKTLGNKIIMNIHINVAGENGEVILELKELIDKYNISKTVYFATQANKMKYCLSFAPEIQRCMLENRDETKDIVEYALEYDCFAVQHFYRYSKDEHIKKAMNNNIKSNYFFEDEPENYNRLIELGVDTILTNYADKFVNRRE